MKLYKKTFNKISDKFYYLYKQYLGKYFRLSSYPYISGDTFRKNCNHVFDELSKFDYKNVKKGDYIFVKTDFIEIFFKEMHPKIKEKYYLLTHNSDLPINSRHKYIIDEKIISWFAQNIEEKFSEKQFLIPIGLENKWLLKNGLIYKFNKILNEKPTKKHLLLASFNVETHESRIHVYNNIALNNLVKFNFEKNKLKYLKELSSSYFNLCPRGNGIDTHRIWESLFFETVPIVNKSIFTNELKNLGVPLFMVDDWNELNYLSKDELIDIYFEITKNKKLNDYVKFEFWNKTINFKYIK